MRKLLRSLTWKEAAEKDPAGENFRQIRLDRFLNLKQVETSVLNYVLDFYVANNEAPQFTTVFDVFTKANKPEEITLIEETGVETFYAGASFINLMEEEIEEQAGQKLAAVCREAVTIATKGINNKGTLVKGVDEAAAYLFSNIQGKPATGTGEVPANMRKMGTTLFDLYQYRKNNPDKTYGVHQGYAIIDHSTLGIRKKSLYIHAGFKGHLKSTQIFNMIINAATIGGWNPVLFTSEMPANDVKLMLVAIHSADPKFNGVNRPIDSRRLLVGALNPGEEAFYKQVEDDLINNPNHGSIRVVDAGEFTGFGSIMQRTIREHVEEEVDLIWIDYLMRLPVDLKYSKMSVTEARNETLIEAKRFAMSFNKGVGLPVCTAFQINRDGWKRAKENGGKYDLAALGQYNAAEAEGDVISYIFYDEEERAINEPKLGILKSRYGAVPNDPVPLYLEPDSRRLFDMAKGMSVTGATPTQGQKSGEEEVAL